MYTTPRKVKQESRLRRSLSLTNTSRLNGGNAPAPSSANASATTVNGEDYSSGEYHRHLHDIEESRDSNTYFQFNGDLSQEQRSRYSYTPGETLESIPDLVDAPSSTEDNSLPLEHHQYNNNHQGYQNSGHKPPPYRGPPPRDLVLGHHHQSVEDSISYLNSDLHLQGVPDSPISPISIDSLQIHSSKFPIVREVVVSSSGDQQHSSGGVTYDSSNRVHVQQEIHQQRHDHSSTTTTSTVNGSDIHRIPVPVLSPDYIKKFQNKKVGKKKQIAWTDERKAFTLDSQTAKDIQQRLAAYPITRTHSADLGKAIQKFNEESYMMASMQHHLHNSNGGNGRHMERGLDNPGLDLGPHSTPNGHHHNNIMHSGSTNNNSAGGYNSGGSKMSGYNYSDSSNSQSLSLSSSNTDSLDTVIYKGPSHSQSTTSIRDWQRSMAESNGDFSHSHRPETNSYRDSSSMFDGRSSYPMQQGNSSYSSMQFNGQPGNNPPSGPGNNPPQQSTSTAYAMEYRHAQQQHQVQQNLSVHSVPSPASSSAGNNAGGNINTHSAVNGGGGGVGGFPRSGNGSTCYGSNPQLPTKSPMLSHKQFTAQQSSTQQQQQQQHVDNNKGALIPNGDQMLVDKPGATTSSSSSNAKDSKLFPTKTYNHIKDMISSRFGGNSGSSGLSSGQSKGLNNSSAVNGASSSNTSSSNVNPNTSNSYIDLTMGVPSSYPQHNSATNGNHHHSTSNGSVVPQQSSYPNGILTNRHHATNIQQAAYYPQNSAGPSTSNGPTSTNGMINGNPAPPNSYRSPNMNDRKNVNTSFRKAIQQSTLKSNLTDDSLQLRPIMESSHPQSSSYANRGIPPPQYNGIVGPSSQSPQKYDPHEAAAQERAQRALDQLMEVGGALQRNGSGPMRNPAPNNSSSGVHNRIQQFQSSYPEGHSSNNGQHYPHSSEQQQQQVTQPQQPHHHLKGIIRYQQQSPGDSGRPVASATYTKPGPASSNSNSSAGLAMIESSLSSPGSYKSTGTNGLPPPTSANSHGPTSSANEQLSHHPQQQPQQWTHLHRSQNSMISEQPPPLPSSQKPDSSGIQGSVNTIGLPCLSGEPRENGDGSSGTMEAPSSVQNLESSSVLCSKSKSDTLKQITTDLQNIALSVAAEHHLHNNNSSSSECEKGSQRVGSGQSHTTTDSGLGTVLLTKSPLNSNSDLGMDGRPNADSISSSNDSEWVDIVEPEIQQILKIEKANKSGKASVSTNNPTGSHALLAGGAINTSTPAVNSKTIHQLREVGNPTGNISSNAAASSNLKTLSGGMSGGLGDITASPIPHPRQQHSPTHSPKAPKKFDLNNYNKKASRNQSQEVLAGPSTSQQAGLSGPASKVKSPRMSSKVVRSNSGSGQRWSHRQQRMVDKSPSKPGGGRSKELTNTLKGAKLTRNAMNKLGQILYSLQDDTGDMTSTTGLDFESAMDGHTEFTTDDDDLSTTIDTTDAHAIRRQLESLESMYTEVLKVLGEKKFSRNRYPPNTAELRATKRRPYGSMSSLPSSVSSRPFRERSRKVDDKKKVKDLKSINRRFQRLESHVVTLARSVAHLSSEMRTQHLMVQEMESIRNEMQTLRNQVVKNSMQSQSAAQNFNRNASGRHGANPCANQTDWTSFRNALPSLTNPCRVRKLTKFFGDEPPLIRIFLKKLGYEKYASAFEQERIGIMELPYLTEDRLNKMGIPMGPRLRILQEAQMCLKPGYHGQPDGHHTHHPNNHNTGNLSVYVV